VLFSGSQATGAIMDNSETQAFDEGVSCFDKGDYDAAIAAFTEAIRLDPTNAKAYGSRGRAYSLKREFEKAIADCTEAIRLDPRDADSYSFRGAANAILATSGIRQLILCLHFRRIQGLIN